MAHQVANTLGAIFSQQLCASAVHGNMTAALARTVMNSLRLIGIPEAQDRPSQRF